MDGVLLGGNDSTFLTRLGCSNNVLLATAHPDALSSGVLAYFGAGVPDDDEEEEGRRG